MRSRSIFPLATQLSATPPAKHRLFDWPSRARLRVIRSTISSVTCCTEAARSMCRWSSGSEGSRGLPPNNALNRLLVIVRRRPVRWAIMLLGSVTRVVGPRIRGYGVAVDGRGDNGGVEHGHESSGQHHSHAG